jgi:ATP-dependent DNA ligase
MAQFPQLYGEASTGKKKVWSIRVFDRDGSGIIETIHGYEDGKMQTNEREVSLGKNIGRKNATTPLQQAISEAKASWVKKRESGYTCDTDVNANTDANTEANSCDAEEKEKTDNSGKGINEAVPSPMLAHDYSKRGKDIVFPCYVQPKLDGTRCVAFEGKLFSRNRKSYPHLEHIQAELSMLHPSTILDGELYSTELTFQEIVGMVKRETLKSGDETKQLKVKYHVYDMIYNAPFEDRLLNLKRLFKKHKFKHLVLVKTDMCAKDEIKEKHAEYVSNGFEGLMLRNANGLYSNARSIHLQKYKEFEDNEYVITGYEEGQGLEKGCVIWVCETDGKTFHVRPRGTREDRQQLFTNGASYVGKKLTVRFQELTSDGIPRFPVGISIRDYE